MPRSGEADGAYDSTFAPARGGDRAPRQGLRMKLCLVGAREGVEQAGEVVWVEGGLEAFGREAALGGVGAQEVEGDLAQQREVARAVAGADPAAVLAERDIQDPVQAVLDPPVAADGGGQARGVRRQAADVVAALVRPLLADPARGLDHDHAPQPGPTR